MVVSWLGLTLATTLGLLALSACQKSVTHRERVPFSQGKVDLIVTSIGGALGEERYELKFNNGNQTQTFFRGGNFSEFSAAERDGKMAVKFCRGFIDLAEPILIGEGEGIELTRLDLDWTCSDDARTKP